jgi:hypothetical protein
MNDEIEWSFRAKNGVEAATIADIKFSMVEVACAMPQSIQIPACIPIEPKNSPRKFWSIRRSLSNASPSRSRSAPLEALHTLPPLPLGDLMAPSLAGCLYDRKNKNEDNRPGASTADSEGH